MTNAHALLMWLSCWYLAEINTDVLEKLGARTAAGIIMAMILLLAFVFWLFIDFGRRLTSRGYLGPLAKDAMARAEIARRLAILDEDWNSRRIEPEDDSDSDKFKLRYQIPSDEVPPALRRDGYSGTTTLPGLGGLGGSARPTGYVPPVPRIGGITSRQTRDGETTDPYASESDLRIFRAQRAEAAEQSEMQNWNAEKLKAERDANLASPADDPETRQTKLIELNLIRSEIYRRFQEGREQERDNAYRKKRSEIAAKETERAEELLPTIDISFLGGGWIFVLEFTTIIFIVFAVLALGILGVLNSEAIAAILAAIAGYVLGKSTSPRGAGSEETRGGGEQTTGAAEAPRTK